MAFSTHNPVQSVAGRTGTVILTKVDVGLTNVDNTLDVNKPVSTAQQTAIDLKMTQHNAAGDPHPQYTTAAEASAAAPIQSITSGRGITASTNTGITTIGSTEFPLVYDVSGAVASPKIWYGVVTSDSNGDFTVNYSTAGFASIPIVNVTAPLTAVNVQDRVWATLQNNATTTTVSGYTIRGAAVLIGGNSVRTAPNTTVMIMAVGI